MGDEEGQWQVDGYHSAGALSPSSPLSKAHETLLDEVSFKLDARAVENKLGDCK